MKRAFIFDLDGVLINNEPLWEKAKEDMFIRLFGQDIYNKIGSTVGSNIKSIHQRAIQLGAHVSFENLYAAFQEYAYSIYHSTDITEGIQELGTELINNNYNLGIVSASPSDWIDLVVDRLQFKKDIKVVISLDARRDLKHKPSPDGYLEVINKLDTIPSSTIVLEDSNIGINSAKAAGIFVIGLRQNLLNGYIQEGADVYVDKVADIMDVLKRHDRLSK